MNRHQYRLAYREARKADRFYYDMREAKDIKVVSMFDTLDLCPRYRSTRLHGDTLRWIGGTNFARNIKCHRSMFECLRNEQRPRLPA